MWCIMALEFGSFSVVLAWGVLSLVGGYIALGLTFLVPDWVISLRVWASWVNLGLRIKSFVVRTVLALFQICCELASVYVGPTFGVS